jgi:hypothetical protein
MSAYIWLTRLSQRLALVETPSGRKFRVKRIDAQTVEALRCGRRGNALPLLFSLLVVSDLPEIPPDDRQHLLATIISGNASIYGIPTATGAPPAASLEERAEAFIESYLAIDELVSAEILMASRSSGT